MNSYTLTNKNIVEQSELIIKKSRFIAKVYYVEDTAEAEKIIDKERLEYKDARHVVYAYRLKNTGKFTDDKEPQGTAGKPIYSILEKEDLVNVLIIVIRYFGGILLGAGPLTRAYANAAKQALDKCEKEEYIEYIKENIVCEYKDEAEQKRKLLSENCVICDIKRTEKVEIIYLKPKKEG